MLTIHMTRESDGQEFDFALTQIDPNVDAAYQGLFNYIDQCQEIGSFISDIAPIVPGDAKWVFDNGNYLIAHNGGNGDYYFTPYLEDDTRLDTLSGRGADYLIAIQPYSNAMLTVSAIWTAPSIGDKKNLNRGPEWLDGLIEAEFIYGETSGPGGGQGGTFDNSSDAIDFATLPSGGAAASGLISMFAPTSSQLASFGQFLWSTLFDGQFDSFLTSLKKWVNDPIESVIQLSAYPVTPPAGAATTLKFCGIRSDLIGSGVVMNKCASQFMDFDFGQIQIPAYWKQALDYSPYTKVSIYLPYIGICPLASDDVIDANLHLKYHIDLLTGGFSAELKVTKAINGTALSSVLYNWSGNMATQIPITSSNFSQVFGSMMTAVAAIGVGAITGGMGAAAAGGGAEAAGSAAVAGGALSGAGHGLAANIGNVINSKPHVTQSGRLDGTVGALSQFTPYLIIERPVQSLSSKFQEEQGYPSNIVQRLGDLSGMTVCEAPIMTGFSGATEEEKEAIRALLCGGVII